MTLNQWLKFAIVTIEADIKRMGFTPVVQFELEGVSKPATDNNPPPDTHHLDFDSINLELEQQGILGLLKPEYWQNQWEYASIMASQSALKAAQDTNAVISLLPTLLKSHGADAVFIKPVCWDRNSNNRPLLEKDNAKMTEGKAVHIPNSVQINMSAFDHEGNNVLHENGLGEALLECFLHTSYECCLLYCAEREAFARYTLKDQYNLHKELSSPVDISSNHMGGVLFHQDKDKDNKPIKNWRQHSRVEHRLGAASTRYNAYLNCVYALSNLHEAILISQGKKTLLKKGSTYTKELPADLLAQQAAKDAFLHGCWFEQKINQIELSKTDGMSLKRPLGTMLKQKILSA